MKKLTFIMKKFIITIFLMLPFTILGDHLTPQEALIRLYGNRSQKLNKSISPVLKYIVNSPNGEDALYIFDRPEEDGYMLISADDRIIPLLGYSDRGSFNFDSISPALNFLIEEYARQIEYVYKNWGNNNIPMDCDNSRLGYEPIPPMISTMWNQNNPYNKKCPEVEGINCMTGCIATAMAQIMNYYHYPEKGKGSVSYYSTLINEKLNMDFSEIEFDWDNMFRNAWGETTMEEVNAVALLMQSCGYSVKTQYTINSSGAYFEDIPKALIDNFNYDNSTIRILERIHYVDSQEWESLLLDNLKNIGPVIYSGYDGIGSHAFICDGYDGEGYFHINWGWGGNNDGYYRLDILNPLWTSDCGGYTRRCSMILGIQPKQEISYVQSGSLSAKLNGSILTLNPYIINTHNETKSLIGAKVINNDNSEENILFMELGEIDYTESSYNFSLDFILDLSILNMVDDQEYDISLVSKSKEPESLWMDILYNGWPKAQQSIKVKKNNDTYKLLSTNGVGETPTISDIELLSPLYDGYPIKVKLTVNNPNNSYYYETIDAIDILGLDNSLMYFSQCFVIYCEPNTVSDKIIVAELNKFGNFQIDEPQEVYLTVNRYNSAVKKVLLYPKSSDPDIDLKVNFIDNSIQDTDKYFLFKDTDSIRIMVDIKVNEGYFGEPLKILIRQNENISGGSFYPYIVQGIEECPMLFAGDSTKYDLTLKLPDFNYDYRYNIRVSSLSVSSNLLKFKFSAPELTIIPENNSILEATNNEIIVSWDSLPFKINDNCDEEIKFYIDNIESNNFSIDFSGEILNDAIGTSMHFYLDEDSFYPGSYIRFHVPKEYFYILTKAGKTIANEELNLYYRYDSTVNSTILNNNGNEYFIYDLYGNLILKTLRYNDIDNLPKGIYIVVSDKCRYKIVI